MKIYSLLVAVLLSFLSYSQTEITKDLGDFNTVKVFDLISVKLIKAKTNSIKITGSYKNDVSVINKNGVLKIRMKIENSFKGNTTTVVLYYNNITTIDANEGAKIEVSNTIKQPSIILKAQEGAEITAQIKTTSATIKAVTGGIINLKGKTKRQDVTINTGGILNAKDLITKQTYLKINAGGEAAIYATDFTDVKINAGGDVLVYGNPKVTEEKGVFGGNITYIK